METSGKLHTPNVLPHSPLNIEQGWVLDPGQMFCTREKTLAHFGIRTPYDPTVILITTPTELSCLVRVEIRTNP
jgi:hypothetical protein